MKSPRGDMSQRTRCALVAAGVSVAAILVAVPYLNGQRTEADLLVLSQAVQAMAFDDRGTGAANGGRPITGAVLYVHLYLDSDASRRVPVPNVRRAWIAYRAWDSLDLAVRAGDTSPPVDSIAHGEEAAALFPSVESFVATSDGTRRFRAADGALLVELRRLVESEKSEALDEVVRLGLVTSMPRAEGSQPATPTP